MAMITVNTGSRFIKVVARLGPSLARPCIHKNGAMMDAGMPANSTSGKPALVTGGADWLR